MTGQREFVEHVVRSLEQHGVEFMITGFIASSFHGEPRATCDVDFVIDCSRHQLETLVDSLQQRGWYVDTGAAMAAHSRRTMFNVIDPGSGWKADLIVRRPRDFSVCEFERRITVRVLGPDSIPLAISTPEDTILSKLEWSRDARSEQQFLDALAVAVIGGGELDRQYLRRWARELDVSDELERLLREADERGSLNP